MNSKWCCCMQVNSVASANTGNNVQNYDITGLFHFLLIGTPPPIVVLTTERVLRWLHIRFHSTNDSVSFYAELLPSSFSVSLSFTSIVPICNIHIYPPFMDIVISFIL